MDSNDTIQNIASLSGNSKCLECGYDNPNWVSFPFSIFVCPKCARLHKKFKKQFKIKSIEVSDFSDYEIKLLSIGGNSRFLNLMNEYKIDLKEPTIENKYLTVISEYYILLLKAEIEKLINNNPNDNKYTTLLSLRPSYEKGIELYEKSDFRFNIDFNNNNNNQNSEMSNHEILKSDLNKAKDMIGGFFGFIGNVISQTAQMTGIDKPINQAKDSITNTMEYYGINQAIKQTGEGVINVGKKVGGFIYEKGNDIAQTSIVKGVVDTVEQSYVGIKEKTVELFGSENNNNNNNNNNNYNNNDNNIDNNNNNKGNENISSFITKK